MRRTRTLMGGLEGAERERETVKGHAGAGSGGDTARLCPASFEPGGSTPRTPWVMEGKHGL
jgi:hypothetical protein